MGMTLGQGKSYCKYVGIGSDKPTTSTTDGTVVEMHKTNFTIAESPKMALKRYALKWEEKSNVFESMLVIMFVCLFLVKFEFDK